MEGKQYSSEELAALVGRAEDEKGKLCLVIGSSWGLAEEVKAACHVRLSVSKMTFPHQLMKVFLLEQIYRAYRILNNEPYHK